MKKIVRPPLRQFVRLLNRVSRPFRHKRVLLLEDDTSMQKLVAKLLRSLHVKVEIFGDGRAVIARIATEGEQYDALLLDLMMPHEGGLTVLRDLRDHHPSLLGRVILVTGSGSGITDPWSPLVFAVVPKPFDGSVLVTTVGACVRQHVIR
jgi:DNA-binding response OmpR family regulator